MRNCILILALGLISCSTLPKKVERDAFVHPEFLRFIQEYEEDFSASVTEIGFDFDILEYDKKKKVQTVGLCTYKKNNRNVRRNIWIDEPRWDKYDLHSKRWLIYHEIAHCYENMAHRNFKLVDGCPGSITHFRIPKTWCIREHWDYYKDELLNQYNYLKWKKFRMDKTGGRIDEI